MCKQPFEGPYLWYAFKQGSLKAATKAYFPSKIAHASQTPGVFIVFRCVCGLRRVLADSTLEMLIRLSRCIDISPVLSDNLLRLFYPYHPHLLGTLVSNEPKHRRCFSIVTEGQRHVCVFRRQRRGIEQVNTQKAPNYKTLRRKMALGYAADCVKRTQSYIKTSSTTGTVVHSKLSCGWKQGTKAGRLPVTRCLQKGDFQCVVKYPVSQRGRRACAAAVRWALITTVVYSGY